MTIKQGRHWAIKELSPCSTSGDWDTNWRCLARRYGTLIYPINLSCKQRSNWLSKQRSSLLLSLLVRFLVVEWPSLGFKKTLQNELELLIFNNFLQWDYTCSCQDSHAACWTHNPKFRKKFRCFVNWLWWRRSKLLRFEVHMCMHF